VKAILWSESLLDHKVTYLSDFKGNPEIYLIDTGIEPLRDGDFCVSALEPVRKRFWRSMAWGESLKPWWLGLSPT
jgi:hypothetical protein